MGIFFLLVCSLGVFFIIRSAGNKMKDAKWSKKCPRCGCLCKPDKDTARMYWKGTGGYPAFFYTCPHCGHIFDNR